MGIVDRLGNIHGRKTGQFESKPPKPIGPLVFFPDIDRSDDEEVGEWIARVALGTGEGAHDCDRERDAPLYIRYTIEDIKDKKGLRREIDQAQDFWAKATALGLTDWCSKEDFVTYFWLDRDSTDWHLLNGGKTGFVLCPDEAIGQQLTEMAKQYPDCRLYEYMDNIHTALYFGAADRDISDEEYEILQNGGTLE